MGKVRDEVAKGDVAQYEDEYDEYTLTDDDFSYLINVNIARNNIIQAVNVLTSSFLHRIATQRFGYESTDDLKFEIDFDNPDKKLKICKVNDKHLYNADAK